MTSKITDLKADIQELNELLKTAKRIKIKEIIGLEIRKLETELIRLTELEKITENSNATEAAATPKTAPLNKCYTVKITNYAWDQSDKFVKIFVTQKNVQTLEPEKITCAFDTRSLELSMMGLENRNYVFTVKGLSSNIVPEKSHWKTKKDMVVLFLAKSRENVKWNCLTENEKKTKEPSEPEPEFDEGGGLMNVMRKMYEEGNDEMKQTIAKIWTETKEKNAMAM